jgi:hypothetical protein
MPDDVRKSEVIETTVGEVAAELARRGLDPHDHITITIASDELIAGRRAGGAGLTGAALIAALQASPCRDIDIEPSRERLPVRDVNL